MHNFSKMAVRAAVSLALFGSVSMANAADTIKIGIAGPLTGPVAQYGDMQFTGGKMAVEQINKAGGIKGKQIEAVIYDDACDPKQAVAIANKVINDGVKFVVGHLCSDNTLPASDIYEDEGVLMVTPASTNPKITERGYQLTLRTIGLDSEAARTGLRNSRRRRRMAGEAKLCRLRGRAGNADAGEVVATLSARSEDAVNETRCGESGKGGDRHGGVTSIIAAAVCRGMGHLRTVQRAERRNCRAFIRRAAGRQQVGYSDRGDNADDHNNDQEFDKRETFLIFHV